MGIVITLVILVIGGWFVWTKVVQPQMSGKYSQLAVEAEKEYAEKGAEMKREAFENPDKFGPLSQVVPSDERLVAIASYLEPRGIGKNLLGEAATMVTNVKKVNMSLFYFILTDKSLHATAFYDGNSVSHDIFDLNEIRDIKLQKGGSNYASGLKDALSGVQGGQYEKLQFTYKDKKYEYNMLLFVEGYPVFETRKDTMSGEFYRIYKANGEKNAVYDYKNIAFYVDSAFRTNLYAEFKKALGERFNADFAA